MSSLVVLRTLQGIPRFSLEVECDGIPCCAISLYDRGTEDTAVRFISKSTGALVFRLRNLGSRGSHHFSMCKQTLHPDEKWDESEIYSSTINEVNILKCGESFDLQRDKTTGCAINLELLKDKEGKVLKDRDVEKKKLARTKWRLQVSPTNDWVGPGIDLNRGTWTIHNLLAMDLPIALDLKGGIISTLDLKRGVSRARDVKNALGHLFGKNDQLFFKGCILHDYDILSVCGVTAFSTVHAVNMSDLPFQIIMCNLNGSTFTFTVRENNFVQDLMEMYHKRQGVPVDKLWLMYGGCVLEKGRTLKEYGITKASRVHVILKLRGGGCLPADTDSIPLVQPVNDDRAQAVSCRPVLTVGRTLNVNPRNLAVGKIVRGKKLKEEKTVESSLRRLMSNATYLQFEIYIDCE